MRVIPSVGTLWTGLTGSSGHSITSCGSFIDSSAACPTFAGAPSQMLRPRTHVALAGVSPIRKDRSTVAANDRHDDMLQCSRKANSR